jgi:acyl carrier protein
LPDPDGTGMSQGEYVAPRTSTEKQLVKIWSEVLRAKEDEIGLESDFFALGGDSIKAINLISKIQKTFGCKFIIAEIFKHSKIDYQVNKIKVLKSEINSDVLVI